MLSTPTAETDNDGHANMDGAQEDLLSGDMENLSQHCEDTPVTEDCSPSDSEREQEPLLQQQPAGSHYPLRTRHPPKYYLLGSSWKPKLPYHQYFEDASDNCQCFCLFTMVACYTLRNLSHTQSLDDILSCISVLNFCTVFCAPKHSPVCANNDCLWT